MKVILEMNVGIKINPAQQKLFTKEFNSTVVPKINDKVLVPKLYQKKWKVTLKVIDTYIDFENDSVIAILENYDIPDRYGVDDLNNFQDRLKDCNWKEIIY